MAHTSELLWLQSLLRESEVPFQTPTLLCDNLNAVMLAHNPMLHARTKHLELDIRFVHEKVVAKTMIVRHVPGSAQLANALTKPLPVSSFNDLRTKLKVVASPKHTLALEGGVIEDMQVKHTGQSNTVNKPDESTNKEGK